MSITSRLEEFLAFKGISNQKFEKLIGMSNGSFAIQVKRNGSIGSAKLEKCLIEFPEINAEWLLTGKGEMLKSFDKVSEPGANYNRANETDLVHFVDKNEQLIEHLNNLIRDKDKIINLLEEKIALLTTSPTKKVK